MLTLFREPEASPIPIAVESRTKRLKKFVVPTPPVPLTIALTNIFDEELFGVIDAESPVTSVQVVPVLVNVSLLVVLAICNIVPLVAVVDAM